MAGYKMMWHDATVFGYCCLAQGKTAYLGTSTLLRSLLTLLGEEKDSAVVASWYL